MRLLTVLCVAAIAVVALAAEDELTEGATSMAAALEGSHESKCPVKQTMMKPAGSCGCPKGGGNCCVKKDGSMGHCKYDGGVCCPFADVCCPANTQCTPAGQCVDVSAATASPKQTAQEVKQALTAVLNKPEAQKVMTKLNAPKVIATLTKAAQQAAAEAQKIGAPNPKKLVMQAVNNAMAAEKSAAGAFDKAYKKLNAKEQRDVKLAKKQVLRKLTTDLQQSMSNVHGLNSAHIGHDNKGNDVPNSVQHRANMQLRRAATALTSAVENTLNQVRAKEGLKTAKVGFVARKVKRAGKKIKEKIKKAVHDQKAKLKARLRKVKAKLVTKCTYKRRGKGCFKCCPQTRRCKSVNGKLKCSVKQRCSPTATSKCPKSKKRKRCFAADTLINMANGPAKRIDQLRLGDVTSGGAVTGVMTFTGEEAHVFDYKGVIVAGEHKVLENGAFIAVSESALATETKATPELLYDINTVTHRIYVRDLTFADFAETFSTLPVVEQLEVNALRRE